MKRLLIIGVIVILHISLISCTEDMSTTDIMTTQIDTTQPITIYSSFDGDARDNNGMIEEYYVDAPVDLNIIDHLNSYANSTLSSVEYKELHSNSDDIEIIPVFGTYLENTSLAVCLFRMDGVLLGTKTISISEIDGEIQINEFKILRGKNYNPFRDSSCFEHIARSLEADPDFQLLGVVFNAIGYTTDYPIDIPEGEDNIKYFFNEFYAFRLVDAFSTIQEGRNAFNEYWIDKTDIIESIPVFPWKTTVFYEWGWIRKYWHQDRFTMGETIEDNLNDYQTVIAIPLLDENGQENRYMLHLLYFQNDLIAEVILKNQDGVSSLISGRYADITTTGGYIPLEGINYVDAVEELLDGVDVTKVVGIVFDGSGYSVLSVD